ncbi:MAG: RecQ family ATP-dependent DNA helicase [Bacteroidetes bacterium]|nr:RecQ family ATP-dependent DNA helicase [Bacteroidota bacterium]
MEEILKKYWGYDHFRPLQKEIIESVLEGKDTLALLPTGGGKSVCFQVPALSKKGICLVISPLIALMKDQVHHLKEKSIYALLIHSGMNFIEVKKTLNNALYGNYKFLYVSPERLESALFLEYLPSLSINLIAIDEAHCISQWGYDFRPAYLNIAAIRSFFPHIPILALTASATPEVQADIRAKLLFAKDGNTFQQSFARPNLSYSAFKTSSRQEKLISILQKVNGSGLVYCKSRKRTKDVADILNAQGINADFYHAGLSNKERNRKQDEWIKDQTRIMCCTNAFGMGIDKADVRVVIHYDVPETLEYYYQEAGRAGRDSKKSYAVLFFNDAELQQLKKKPEIKFPPIATIRKIYEAICNYFQIPSGTGEEEIFEFDINTFVKNFKLEASQVNNTLKILEQENILNYSELYFAPATVIFTASKNDLETIQKNYLAYEPVIKGLLRLYDGILDFPSAIDETQLSHFISLPLADTLESLQALNRMKLIDYTPQKDKPQIIFKQNRVKTSELYLNERGIHERKKAFEKRITTMVNFTIEKSKCRSQFISFYFNDLKAVPCGVCDNCIGNKKNELSQSEFQSISEAIRLAASQKITLDDLMAKIRFTNKIKFDKVFNFLQEENILNVTSEGLISLKNVESSM